MVGNTAKRICASLDDKNAAAKGKCLGHKSLGGERSWLAPTMENIGHYQRLTFTKHTRSQLPCDFLAH